MATHIPNYPLDRSVEERVLEVIRMHPDLEPSEVISKTADQLRIASISVREAIWHLISQGELLLSETQSLMVSPTRNR